MQRHFAYILRCLAVCNIYYCHVTGQRSQGRQAKKWIENVKKISNYGVYNLKMPYSQRQRQNCMETANIINLIVIVTTDEKKEEEEEDYILLLWKFLTAF